MLNQENNFNIDEFENVYKIIADNVEEGIWIIDENERTQYVNEKLCDLLGYKEENMIGECLFSFIDEEGKHKAQNFLQKRKNGLKERHLFSFLGKNNQKIDLLLKASPITDKNGNYKGAIAFVSEANSEERKKRFKRIQEELDFIIDNIPALVYYKDKSNHLIKANYYVAKAHNTTKKELEGKHVEKLYPKEKAAEYYKDDLEVINSGKPKMHYEEKWVKNGEEKWVKTSKVPLKDDEGKINGILGVSFDITEQKKAAAIIKKKLEFETIISSISSRFIGNKLIEESINKSLQDIGIVSGADRVFLFEFNDNNGVMNNTFEWTNEFTDSIQLKCQNLKIDKYAWLMTYLLDGKIIKLNDLNAIPQYAQNTKEFFKIRESKSTLIFPIFTQSEVSGFIGFETVEEQTTWNDEDFTLLRFLSQIVGNAFERKKAEEKLRESEEKFRLITEQSQVGIGIIQDDFIQYANNEFSKIIGYDLKTILNWKKQDLLKVVHRGDKHIIYSLFKEEKDKISPNGQFRIISNNNDEKWASVFFNRLIIGGKPAELYVLIDITEKKKSELLEQQFKEELEREVKIRTNKLEEALEKQKLYLDQIAKSSQFKSEFLATMSHELRTPLNAIIGFTDILLEELYGPLEGDQKDYLNDINTSAEHLLEMITRILDISKIESGQLTLNLKEFSLNTIVEQVKTTLKPMYKKKNLDFEIQGLEQEKTMRADPIRFKEALLNLLSNAIKYTIEGKVSIKIREGRQYWILKVKDTGIGIAQKDQHLIFKEFKRVDTPYVRSVQGTGLGLSLTKRLIDLHKGEITFTSVLGSGTVFTVKIPKNIEEVDEFENLF